MVPMLSKVLVCGQLQRKILSKSIFTGELPAFGLLGCVK